MSRDEEQARRFAVEWSTKGKGKIANLAGCYLRASQEKRDVEIALLEEVLRRCGALILDRRVDLNAQAYGISSAKEVVLAMLQERLAATATPSEPTS